MNYEIDKKTSEQITILKGLLMVLVVFIHSYREEVTFVEKRVILLTPEWLEWLKYFISQVLARAAVPAFFMISAVLLYRKPFVWMENMRKKIRTILIPYLLLNGFWILFFYVAKYIDFTVPYLAGPQSRIEEWGVIGWLDAFFGNFVDEYPVLYPMWFMRDLFLLNLASIGIKKCVDRFPVMVLCFVSVIWLLPLPIPIIGGTKLSGQSLVFFVLGYYVVKYRIRIRDIDKIPGVWIAGIYAVSVAVTVFFRGTVYHYTLLHITIVAGIAVLVKISGRMAQSRGKSFYLRFASYSFYIFAFHEMGLTILTKILARNVHQTVAVQVIEYFGIPIVMIGICMILGWLLKTYFPKLNRLLTGGR